MDIRQVEICPLSDESKFEIFGSNCRVFVRRIVGERMISTCMVPTVKHGGGGVMVWGALLVTIIWFALSPTIICFSTGQ